jgi:hypothetical protein
MSARIRKTLATVFGLTLLLGLSAGCGGSDGNGLSLRDIPPYPNASEGESMEQTSPGGLVGGGVSQFTTTDSFDQVLGFYTDALSSYQPESLSHTSELGRQAALTVTRENGLISVVIQEFTEEGKVNITFMSLGR